MQAFIPGTGPFRFRFEDHEVRTSRPPRTQGRSAAAAAENDRPPPVSRIHGRLRLKGERHPQEMPPAPPDGRHQWHW
jgi:hypothetical protein